MMQPIEHMQQSRADNATTEPDSGSTDQCIETWMDDVPNHEVRQQWRCGVRGNKSWENNRLCRAKDYFNYNL